MLFIHVPIQFPFYALRGNKRQFKERKKKKKLNINLDFLLPALLHLTVGCYHFQSYFKELCLYPSTLVSSVLQFNTRDVVLWQELENKNMGKKQFLFHWKDQEQPQIIHLILPFKKVLLQFQSKTTSFNYMPHVVAIDYQVKHQYCLAGNTPSQWMSSKRNTANFQKRLTKLYWVSKHQSIFAVWKASDPDSLYQQPASALGFTWRSGILWKNSWP